MATVDPVANATSTLVSRAVLAGNPNPTVPPFTNDMQWLAAYLAIHMLSVPSRRYSYLLWFVIAFVFVVFSISHLLGLRSSFIGAYWSKWSIQRKTWRKGRKVAGVVRLARFTYPSNAQILSLATLFVVTAILCCVGPDYIRPTIGTFDLSRRSGSFQKRVYFDPLQFLGYAPQYTISKAWWTAGGRTGMMAYTLFPLCVLFAIRGSPFALFSIRRLVQMQFDKLSWLHWFTGWFIWFLATLHVVFWSIQLLSDRRTSPFAGSKAQAMNQKPYDLVWNYTRFIYAWIAYGLLTLLVTLSIAPLRRSHYETFYFLHILLVPLTLVLSALHHPPIWWWCWAALILWLGDRLWRGARWLHINGIFSGVSKNKGATTGALALPRNSDVNPSQKTLQDSARFKLPITPPSKMEEGSASYPPTPISAVDSPGYHIKSPSSISSMDQFLSPPGHANTSYVAPPGFLHAELLAGHTIRVTFTPARPITWAPGQHFLITVPAITSFTSHPFTTASICDTQAVHSQIVLLIRAKKGWTRDLWDEVAAMSFRNQKHAVDEVLPEGTELPTRGVVLRGLIDGPFGSSGRVRWGDHATVLLVAGGSGVSFTLSVLEYICLCMAGRDGRELGGQPSGPGQRGFRVKRVRFVWIIREFSHIQWCAPILRRCMDLVPFPGLQIDIFVTNAAMPTHRTPAPSRPTSVSSVPEISVVSPSGDPSMRASVLSHPGVGEGHLVPPAPRFARGQSPDGRSSGGESDYSAFDLGYYQTGPAGAEDDLEDIMDLTNWDGENDAALPGENRLSRQVQSAGRHLRTMSRRMSQFHFGAGGVSDDRGQSWFGHAAAGGGAGASAGVGEKVRWSHMSSTDRLISAGMTSDGSGGDVRASRRRSRQADALIHGPSPLAMGARASSSKSPPPRRPRSSVYMGPSPIEEGSHEGSLADSVEEDSATAGSRPTSWVSVGGWDARSNADSVHELVEQPATPPTAPTAGIGARWLRHSRSKSEMVRVEVETQEMQDLSAVAEFARPGRPRLNRFLAEEVDRSAGSVVVGCCGPASLNAMIRKVIAAQIDPARIRKGDMRGHILLVSEEFDY